MEEGSIIDKFSFIISGTTPYTSQETSAGPLGEHGVESPSTRPRRKSMDTHELYGSIEFVL